MLIGASGFHVFPNIVCKESQRRIGEREWALQINSNYFSLLCLYFSFRGELHDHNHAFYIFDVKGDEFRCEGRAWQGHSLGAEHCRIQHSLALKPEHHQETWAFSLCNNCILWICWRTSSLSWGHCSASVSACNFRASNRKTKFTFF